LATTLKQLIELLGKRLPRRQRPDSEHFVPYIRNSVGAIVEVYPEDKT
jgi:hypothetical protein